METKLCLCSRVAVVALLGLAIFGPLAMAGETADPMTRRLKAGRSSNKLQASAAPVQDLQQEMPKVKRQVAGDNRDPAA